VEADGENVINSLNEKQEKFTRSVHGNFRGIKGKFVSVYAIKPHRGSRGTAPVILNLCARRE
jgi:hypothetical protein